MFSAPSLFPKQQLVVALKYKSLQTQLLSSYWEHNPKFLPWPMGAYGIQLLGFSLITSLSPSPTELALFSTHPGCSGLRTSLLFLFSIWKTVCPNICISQFLASSWSRSNVTSSSEKASRTCHTRETFPLLPDALRALTFLFFPQDGQPSSLVRDFVCCV